MKWQLALSVPANEDLSGFSRWLYEQQIGHRISEASGNQQVWVADAETAELVKQLYQQFQDMPADNLEFISQAEPAMRSSGGWKVLIKRFPLTLLILLLTLLVALWTGVGSSVENMTLFTFNAVMMDEHNAWFMSLPDTLADGQWWRLFTPILIHFGWLHLAMNALWLWELGRRIELQQGSLFFISFVLLAALGSNLSQYWASGPSFFGGLSGVLYALLGFCWIHQRLAPVAAYMLPKGVIGMMLIWLLLCLSGLITALGFGQIANAAHVSGLLIGCLLGGLAGWRARSRYIV